MEDESSGSRSRFRSRGLVSLGEQQEEAMKGLECMECQGVELVLLKKFLRRIVTGKEACKCRTVRL